MINYTNEAESSRYLYEKPKTNWTSTAEMKKKLTFVEFHKNKKLEAGGIPIISDGKTAYIDTSDNHCVINGSSGFKKSLCVFMPAIYSMGHAGESMVIHDPKGEIYSRTAAFLKALGYRIIVLNFRDFNGDGYNPLHLPAKLWKSGNVDKAASITNDFNSAIAYKQDNNDRVDSFWPTTAKATNSGVLHVMYDSYENIDDINVLSLADYYTEKTADYLKDFVNESRVNNTAMTNLRTVLSEPEKTRQSTLATASSFIQPFIQNDKLARMLSHSTFELEDIAEEKTALFMITDDTTTVCHPIVGMLVSQLNTVLVDKAFHSENGKLETRVNFILDEFCSLPIPGICEALATQRSRNIRYYLCVQSIDALSEKYPRYESLLANCATSLFLGSTEMKLLERVSSRCGETQINRTGAKEPLISVPELMTLKKDWYYKEALYFNLAENIRYCTSLPAIELYKDAEAYGKCELPNIEHPQVTVYTFCDLLHDISTGRAKKPFTDYEKPKQTKKKENKKEAYLGAAIQRELAAKFEELFGPIDDEEEE